MAFHNLIVKSFKKGEDPDCFEKALRVRTEVFVEEQHVPADHEVDALDETATHFVVLDPIDPMPLATGRMYPDTKEQSAARLGRMAVRKTYRGQGIGRVLLDAILGKAEQEGYEQAVCDAQTHALPYYAKHGFVAEGDEFLDENIPHYLMRKPLQKEKASSP